MRYIHGYIHIHEMHPYRTHTVKPVENTQNCLYRGIMISVLMGEGTLKPLSDHHHSREITENRSRV